MAFTMNAKSIPYQDKEAFEIYLKDFGITMDNLKKKIEIETTWNQLRFY